MSDDLEEKSLKGTIANPGFAIGKAWVIKNGEPVRKREMGGYILISHYSSPEVAILAYNAEGIVTDVGGVMSHLGVVAREIGLPCLVATEEATLNYQNEEILELNAEGNLGGRE